MQVSIIQIIFNMWSFYILAVLSRLMSTKGIRGQPLINISVNTQMTSLSKLGQYSNDILINHQSRVNSFSQTSHQVLINSHEVVDLPAINQLLITCWLSVTWDVDGVSL